MLRSWGVDTSTPGITCHFAYLESATKGHISRHGGSRPSAAILENHLLPLDAPAPTLSATGSSHPFFLGLRPQFLGPRALITKLGLPPTDRLSQAILDMSPRRALLAVGRGVHFLSARAVLHLVLAEPQSALCDPAPQVVRWATAFTGADLFGVALRAALPNHSLLAASEVRLPPFSPLCPEPSPSCPPKSPAPPSPPDRCPPS